MEHLLAEGYEVHGLVRRTSSVVRPRVDHLAHSHHRHAGELPLTLHYGDVTDGGGIFRLVLDVEPDEIYNLAGQSHVHLSYDQPEYTALVNGIGTVHLLEAIRASRRAIRYYESSTSEIFGEAPAPQDETTPFSPRNPYGAAKLYALWMTRFYRRTHGVFACSAILYNHESPRRGENFVTRKVTRAVAEIVAGRQEALRLGDLDAARDWGHARDYVRAMHLLMQLDEPTDVVIATGRTHTIRELVATAFGLVGLDWRRHVVVDPAYVRSPESTELRGDSSRARALLGWAPTVTFEEMILEMLEHDLAAAGVDPARARSRRE